MPFTPLNEQDIITNLVNTYSALIPKADDLNRGSVIRSIFTAFAMEQKRIYAGLVEDGAELQKTAQYSQLKFNLLPAQAAYTMEQFSVATAPTADTPVAAGTLVDIPGTSVQYQTVADATWPANATSVTLRVVCTQTGIIGNTPSGTITELLTPISGLSGVTVTNTKDVKTGREIETEDERAQRFNTFISTLHRGDASALKYGAQTAQLIDEYGYVTEQVVKVQVVEGTGSNTIYIDNGTYDTSTNLVTQCQQVINGYVDTDGNLVPGYKAAGIPSTVQAATIQQVTVTVSVKLEAGYTLDMVQTTIQDSITSLVESLDVGDTLYLSDIGLAIRSVPGVANYTITAPTADTAPAAGTLIKLQSTPTVTAA